MVQYNSLRNDSLIARGSGSTDEPEMNHEDFVAALVDNSVELDPLDEDAGAKFAEAEGVETVVYPSEAHLYPSLNEIQGVCRDADGNECSVADFVKMKCGEIGEKDIALHPSSTHLVFYDMSGTRKGGGQNLPWTEVDKLHDYLNKKEGVAEGCLLCNGDHTDLQSAQSFVSKATPVLTLKSVGGASEFLSQLFERRQVGGPDDSGRPVGFVKRFPSAAVPEEFRSGVFVPPDEATDEEMIVVDCNNP